MNNYLCRGGIGDFLQSIDFLREISKDVSSRLVCLSHFKNINDLVSPFFPLERSCFITSNSSGEYLELNNLVSHNNLLHCKRSFYQSFNAPENSVGKALIKKKAEQKIIGIHPCGSQFSKSVYDRFGFPSKVISPEIVASIINNEYHYFIFGSIQELNEYKKVIKAPNIDWICEDNIWDSLAHVLFCDKVIAIDSSIKTMSSIKKIPTYVAVGNFQDDMRDMFFINHYVKDGVMKVFKYSNLENQKNNFISFINEEVYSSRG